eukprot:COSAG05_NODE_24153_length_253_cov_0.993506_2_plen_20_part_01
MCARAGPELVEREKREKGET